MNVENYIDNQDIIEKIYSYITYPQPKELLNDIRNFYHTKRKLNKIYKRRYQHEPEEYQNWLYNDILCYFNEDKPIMLGITRKYFNILKRHYMLKDSSDHSIERYINVLEIYRNTNSLINIYLSKLTIEERIEFLNCVCCVMI